MFAVFSIYHLRVDKVSVPISFCCIRLGPIPGSCSVPSPTDLSSHWDIALPEVDAYKAQA